jgi:hypothetical protein
MALVPTPDAAHVVAPDGEAFIWRPSPKVVVQQARGVLSLPIASCFADFYRPLLVADVRVTIFDDFEELTHYTREARALLTELTKERIRHIDVIHFLLSSKFMSLGVGTFKHDVSDERVRTYSDRQSFMRSYEEALKA